MSDMDSGGDDLEMLTGEDAHPTQDEERQREEAPESDDSEEQAPRPRRTEKSRPEPRQAAEKAPAKPAEKPAPKRYTVKVGQQEDAIEGEEAEALERVAKRLGLRPEDMTRTTQVMRAGHEAMRRAAELEKKQREAEESQRKRLEDPEIRQIMAERPGLKAEDAAAIVAVRKLMQQEQMSPEARRLAEMSEENARLKAEQDRIAHEAEERETTAEQQRQMAKLDGQLKEILTAGGIPPTIYAVARLANHMQQALAEGVEADDLEPADFVPMVLEDLQAEHAKWFDSLSGDDILRLYPDHAEKVRKAYVARAQKARGQTPEQRPADERQERQPQKRRVAFTGTAGFISQWANKR